MSAPVLVVPNFKHTFTKLSILSTISFSLKKWNTRCNLLRAVILVEPSVSKKRRISC